MEAYTNLANLSEDDRIRVIGEFVMKTRKASWCITDSKPKDKVERYKDKMHKWFPLLVLGDIKRNMPFKQVSTFEVKPPPHS